jgi:hypothetical protein
METEAPGLVRRHWSFVLAYTVVAAFAVGFGLSLALMIYVEFRHPDARITFHERSVYYLILSGVIFFTVFVIQVLTGPLAFTRNVVCKTCCRPRKLARSPFFGGGRGYRMPKCEDCGGELEAAIFWKSEKLRKSG